MKGPVSIRIRGQVQGVGFRPYVWQLAREFGISGSVCNDPQGVLIEARGERLADFLAAIAGRAPSLSRIDGIEVMAGTVDLPEGFRIALSRGVGSRTGVTPDAAVCEECIAEIRGDGRRRLYPFTNCTRCGPRYTILRELPYDRGRTTMADFALCTECRQEYEDPSDRRFHAQPIACPRCGPRLWLEVAGQETPGDALGMAVERLRAGEILAIKGLGGFHLACDAQNGPAVERLRARKHRPAKPLALMAHEDRLAALVEIGQGELGLLRDSAAPIVLAPSRGVLPEAIAPGMNMLGVMLPYTPLHVLLLDAFDGVLVMTSGNLSGEPQVVGNDEARSKLSGFADAFLMHDRDIARRLDDGVERANPPMVIRRARGRAPGTLPMPPGFEPAPHILALGGQMKGAICLIKDGQAMLSHHLGDLDDALCADEFERAIADCSALFDHRPDTIAIDAHPGYRASIKGRAMGLPVDEIWHHHAHLAACLAENRWPLDAGPVAGIVLDGTGLGPDGTLWGGELIVGDYRSFERSAWLQPAPLAGGDRAAREPWRNALMRLDQAGLHDWADRCFSGAARDVLRRAARLGVNAPASSSAGRLFDAVAACLAICAAVQTYEGEAAMRLEALAAPPPDRFSYAAGRGGGEIDCTDMMRAVIADIEARQPVDAIAWRFHAWLARSFAARARDLVVAGRAGAVALSGGCFQNALLLTLTLESLEGVPVLVHRKVPANDGGLALGQAAIAAARRIRGAESL